MIIKLINQRIGFLLDIKDENLTLDPLQGIIIIRKARFKREALRDLLVPVAVRGLFSISNWNPIYLNVFFSIVFPEMFWNSIRKFVIGRSRNSEPIPKPKVVT